MPSLKFVIMNNHEEIDFDSFTPDRFGVDRVQ